MRPVWVVREGGRAVTVQAQHQEDKTTRCKHPSSEALVVEEEAKKHRERRIRTGLQIPPAVSNF